MEALSFVIALVALLVSATALLVAVRDRRDSQDDRAADVTFERREGGAVSVRNGDGRRIRNVRVIAHEAPPTGATTEPVRVLICSWPALPPRSVTPAMTLTPTAPTDRIETLELRYTDAAGQRWKYTELVGPERAAEDPPTDMDLPRWVDGCNKYTKTLKVNSVEEISERAWTEQQEKEKKKPHH